MTYTVTTIETLSRQDTIEADSVEDAEKKADKRHQKDESYRCNYDEDFDGTEFEIC